MSSPLPADAGAPPESPAKHEPEGTGGSTTLCWCVLILQLLGAHEPEFDEQGCGGCGGGAETGTDVQRCRLTSEGVLQLKKDENPCNNTSDEVRLCHLCFKKYKECPPLEGMQQLQQCKLCGFIHTIRALLYPAHMLDPVARLAWEITKKNSGFRDIESLVERILAQFNWPTDSESVKQLERARWCHRMDKENINYWHDTWKGYIKRYGIQLEPSQEVVRLLEKAKTPMHGNKKRRLMDDY